MGEKRKREAGDKKKSEHSERTYYVVTAGRRIGIYRDKKKAFEQVHGYPDNRIKKIRGLDEARRYFNKHKNTRPDTYYVVRRGRSPGLYKDYEQALEKVKGFPHGRMKKIVGYDRAMAYLNKDLMTLEFREEADVPRVYIDGSYMQHIGMAGFGYVVEQEGKIVHRNSGVILDSDMLNLHSLGAEVFALLRAMEWGLSNGAKELHVIYDSTAILDLIDNNDTTKVKRSRGKSKFLDIYTKYSQHITVVFKHRKTDELFRHFHRQAHHLSRLTLDALLTDEERVLQKTF